MKTGVRISIVACHLLSYSFRYRQELTTEGYQEVVLAFHEEAINLKDFEAASK